MQFSCISSIEVCPLIIMIIALIVVEISNPNTWYTPYNVSGITGLSRYYFWTRLVAEIIFKKKTHTLQDAYISPPPLCRHIIQNYRWLTVISIGRCWQITTSYRVTVMALKMSTLCYDRSIDGWHAVMYGRPKGPKGYINSKEYITPKGQTHTRNGINTANAMSNSKGSYTRNGVKNTKWSK